MIAYVSCMAHTSFCLWFVFKYDYFSWFSSFSQSFYLSIVFFIENFHPHPLFPSSSSIFLAFYLLFIDIIRSYHKSYISEVSNDEWTQQQWLAWPAHKLFNQVFYFLDSYSFLFYFFTINCQHFIINTTTVKHDERTT